MGGGCANPLICSQWVKSEVAWGAPDWELASEGREGSLVEDEALHLCGLGQLLGVGVRTQCRTLP